MSDYKVEQDTSDCHTYDTDVEEPRHNSVCAECDEYYKRCKCE